MIVGRFPAGGGKAMRKEAANTAASENVDQPS
jgi:hypothetical protein